MSAKLDDLAESVVDEVSFAEFMIALSEDWEDERQKEAEHASSPYGPGANGWENGTIGAFLEAAASWAEESRDRPKPSGAPLNPWRRAAQILLAGKSYE